MIRRGFRARCGLAVLAVALVPSDSPVRAAGTITGVVFQDFNGNGIRDLISSTPTAGGFGTASLAVDRGLPGIVVAAVDGTGAIQGTTTTGSDGSYLLATGGSGPYRVEFSSLPSGFFPGPFGAQNGTTIRFVPDGDSAGVDLGLVRPLDYAQDNPDLVTSIYVFGDPLAGPNSAQQVLGSFPLNAGAAAGAPIPNPNPDPNSPDSGGGPYLVPQSHALAVPVNQIGATWGLAYSPFTARVYAAAFTKKFAGYGPNGTGAIYQTITTGDTATLFADLNAIFGANTAGENFRTAPTWAGYNSDGFDAGWDAVGKTALGGLDLSQDGGTLYVMNLFDRMLYLVPTSGPLDATTVRRFPVPNPITLATSTDPGLDFRPFAVALHEGTVFVGAINSAESTQDRNNLRAFVLAFDPATETFASTPVLQFDLNYPRGIGNAFSIPVASANWLPWRRGFSNLATAGQFGADTIYPQPWLTGLAFAPNGDLVLGFRDRTGDQTGVQTPDDPAQPTTLRRGIAVGDILRASFNSAMGTFALENNATVGGTTSAGAFNQQGPGGGEFYYQDVTPLPPGFPTATIHDDMTVGGVLQVPGLPEVATTTINPIMVAGYFSRGGLRWFDNASGELRRAYEVYYSGPVSEAAITFSKANGIGDLIAIPRLPPVEIGNRVWRDTNQNGLQDPQEPAIAGVAVRLHTEAGTLLASAVTDGEGRYFFSNGPGVTTASAVYQVGADVLGPTSFTVRLDNPADYTSGGPLAGLIPTSTVSVPSIDSNGIAVAARDIRATVVVQGPGQNDHTIDFGFVEGADIEVLKIVDPLGMVPGGRIHVVPGQVVSFWMKALNHGPAAAAGIVIADLIPAGMRLTSFVVSQGTFDPRTGVWMVGDLPVGGMAQADIMAVIDGEGEFANVATRVASQPSDPNPRNDSSTATFVVSQQPDLDVSAVFLPSLQRAHVVDARNPTALVRFFVRNTSFLPVPTAVLQGGVRATDGVAAVTILSAAPSAGAVDLTSGTWSPGPLAPGDVVTLDVAVRMMRATRVELELRRLTSGPGDSDASNDRAVVTLEGVAPNRRGRHVALGRTTQAATGELILGGRALEPPLVHLFDVTGTEVLTFAAADPAAPGGVRVAACDLDGDGRDEILTTLGLPVGGSQVRVFTRRVDGSVAEIARWSPLGDAYAGGLHLACGDVDGDGRREIITGSGADGPATVQLWRPHFATETALEVGRGLVPGILPGYGVRVAACDLTGDGRAEIVAVPAGGGLPIVRIYDVARGRFLPAFAPARPDETVGLHVACGDVVPGSGNEILFGFDGAGIPLVRAFSGDGTLLGEYLGFGAAPGVGADVAAGEFDGDVTVGEFAVVSSHDTTSEGIVGTVRADVSILLRLALPAPP